jgi:hypothetical protein
MPCLAQNRKGGIHVLYHQAENAEFLSICHGKGTEVYVMACQFPGNLCHSTLTVFYKNG